jgi:hypothetical protein
MENTKEPMPALQKAQEEGIDLTLVFERLFWTPTERIEKHLQMLEFADALRKAGQKHHGQSQGRKPSKGTS